jgi:hypothetical protein
MCRGLVALFTAAGTAFLPLGVAWSATAVVEETVASLRISCSTLGVEGRGALEARARAEIVLAPRPAGEVVIECAAQSALVAWRAPDGSLRQRTVALDDDPTTSVDGLLGAVHALRFEQPRRAPRAAVARVANAGTPHQPVAVTVAAVPRARDPVRWAAVAGTEAELWQGAIRGAVGAYFGARVVTPDQWSVGLLAGAGRGWSRAGAISAYALRVMLNVAYAPSRHVEFGLGAEVRGLFATVSDAAGFAERHGVTEGAIATMRYRIPLGPIELSLGPQIEALAQPLVVQVTGQEIFRIPTLVAGFSVYGQRAAPRSR